MAIIKLVCQGCGANLDALDTSRIVPCGYCGTQNQIKRTVYQEAPPAPAPAPAPPPPVAQAPLPQHAMQYQVVQPVAQPRSSGRGLALFIVLATVVPMIASGVIAFVALSPEMVSRGQSGGRALEASGGPARQFFWQSGRPFAADLDGDGSEDLLGIVQVVGETPLTIVAVSGADWHVLWETDIGDRATMPDQPRLRYIESQAGSTAIFAMGAAIRAFDGKTGQQKWVANLPDKTSMMVLDGDHLWIRSIDESTHTVALTTGVVTPTKADPSSAAKSLRTDYGYDLIPSNDQLDLESEQFADVRIETAFCPPELLAIALDNPYGHDPVPCTWNQGLAWVARTKGTAVPFLIGYDPATKQERWRQQLTPAGSLETIDGGFNQPRAEFVDQDAVISFSPTTANGAATIRRISMADGSTKWEAILARKSTENVDGMVIGKDRLYINHGSGMVVLDLATGKEIERLGGW